MGKIFIPMFTPAAHYYQPARTQRRCQRRAPAMNQPSLLDVLLSDYLSQLCSQPTSKNCYRSGTETRPWIYSVNLKGFEPEDIAVKVEDGVVHITARHIEETEEGHDVVQRYRKVRLPENIDDEKLNCLMTEEGKLILKATFRGKHPSTKAEDTPVPLNESSKVTSTKSPYDSEDKVCNTGKQQPEVIDIPIEHDDTQKKVENVEQHVRDTTLQDETRKEETQSHKTEDEGDKPHQKVEEQSEIHLSRPNTPQEAIEFVILGDVTPSQNPEQTDEINAQHEENILNIQGMENEVSLPFKDTTKIIETDGKKEFEINLNLEDFTPENTLIRWKNDSLEIDAKREVKSDSFSTFQKIHRVYTVPEHGVMREALASMNNDGMLRVTVPLKNEA